MRSWALVALAVAAAAVAALAARAVLAVPAGSGATGSGMAGRLLVPADLRAERTAEADFATAPRSGPPAVVLRRRVQLETALSGIATGAGRSALRSRAATLLSARPSLGCRSTASAAVRTVVERTVFA